MKKKLLILFVLSLLLNLSKTIDESLNKSSVSKLIEMVREDIIDKSLLYLPKINEVNILQMCNQMSTVKEKYLLSDIESAYLVFKWITQNIQTYLYKEEGLDDPIGVYTSGKASPKGVSSLFNLICGFWNIKTDSISGYLKLFNIYEADIEIKKNYTWNYIEIDGEYFLIDLGMAYDLKVSNFLDYIYVYFGTDPEIFIRLHFPNESKWQLLSKTYTFEKFESMAFLNPFFYLLGFKAISPDINILNGRGEIKMTSDKSIPEYQILYCEFDKEEELLYHIDGGDGIDGIIKAFYDTEYNKLAMINLKFTYAQLHIPFFPIIY